MKKIIKLLQAGLEKIIRKDTMVTKQKINDKDVENLIISHHNEIYH